MVKFRPGERTDAMKNEDDLKRKCVSWMKKDAPPWLWFYSATDRYYSGIPDIIFCARGRFGWVELKMPKGKVTPIQQWTHNQMMSAGAQGAVCRSFEEFKEFVLSFFTSPPG
jgi:hypothetical protein